MVGPDEVPPPTTARPKYLGPPPPPYPLPAPPSEPQLGADRRWMTRHLVVGCVLSFLLGMGTCSVASRGDSSPEPEAGRSASVSNEVARFSGTGPQTTSPFTVDSAWELRWQSDSGVSIEVHSALERVRVGTPSHSAGGSGSSFQPEPGSYLLEVTAAGTWTITVVQLA